MDRRLKKVVAIGPESTGKSTICEQLAGHYDVSSCPEFAREYLLEHGMNYSYEDLLTIAMGQLALEEKFVSAAISRRQRVIFIDTDMYVMKIWCEFVFGKCHPWILKQIAEKKYDLYLLCNVDLAWIKDELREYPDPETRKKLFQIYKDLMINQITPWVEISGSSDERLQRAIAAVDNLIEE